MRARLKSISTPVSLTTLVLLLALVSFSTIICQPCVLAQDAVGVGKPVNGECAFSFPEDKPYGSIYLLSKNEILTNSGPRGKKVADARGKIAIKASDGIIFKGNAFLALQPELLGSLPPRCTKVLLLQNLEISDQSFSYAKKLTRLGHLDLRDTDVTDASFKTIGNFERLEYLSLISTGIDGSGFSELARLPMLRSFRVSGNALKHFKGLESLQQVTFLDISASRIGDLDLPSLGKMRDLEHLELRKTAITDKGLKALRGLKHLKNLDVRGTKVTVDGIKQLAGIPLIDLCFDRASAADEKSLSHDFPGIRCSDYDKNRDLAPTIFAPLH